MAPNHHPEYLKTLAENKTAFYRKTGMSAAYLDDGRSAVTRKSNALLENSRVAAGGNSSCSLAGGSGFVFR